MIHLLPVPVSNHSTTTLRNLQLFYRQRHLQQEETLPNVGGLEETANPISILAQHVASSHS